jgi:hypothetical protein
MSKSRLVAVMIGICLVDVIVPIPILGLLLIHVIFTRPAWFRTLVDNVYGANR